MTDSQVAHLGMIQGVINRMASNSFALKALAVTIAAAVIALASTQTNPALYFSYVGLLPVFVFWIMDAQYLRLERLYRKLYDHIRAGNDFEPFSMNIVQFKPHVSPTVRIAFSWSVIWFYAAVATALVATTYFQHAQEEVTQNGKTCVF